jgi:predicted lipoprotein with Yx(FWY)xxD motif
MKYLNHLPVAITFVCSLLITSCKKEPSPPTFYPTVQLQNHAELGSYLTDSVGFTLYYFSNDFNGISNCTGGCLAVWPIYYAGDLTAAKLAQGLDIADFGTVTAPGGGKQTTYKGWPLYYYAPAVNGTNVREAVGETKGEAVGNIWYVAKPDYSVMLMNAQLVGNDGKNYKGDYTEGTGRTLYFSDPKGVTLYAFKPDKFNVNTYTKSDFSNNPTWPIYETNKAVVPSTIDKTLFASTNVFGKTQLTYKGWPMYYFGPDNLTRGLNKGVSVPTPGIWPVVVKDIATAPQ